MKLLPSQRVLYTPYNHAPCHFRQSHLCKVHACLAATCHLHVWQNDRDVLHATAVTWGWNGYRNKTQHKKSWPRKKKILLPLLQWPEPVTFRSRVQHSNHWAIPALKLITHPSVNGWKAQSDIIVIMEAVSANLWRHTNNNYEKIMNTNMQTQREEPVNKMQ